VSKTPVGGTAKGSTTALVAAALVATTALAAAIAALADSRARLTDASWWILTASPGHGAGPRGCSSVNDDESAKLDSAAVRAEKGTGSGGGDAENDAVREMRIVSGGVPNGEGSRDDGTR
jgi:hypothetical protein